MKRGKNIFYLIYKIFYGPIKTSALHSEQFCQLMDETTHDCCNTRVVLFKLTVTDNKVKLVMVGVSGVDMGQSCPDLC